MTRDRGFTLVEVVVALLLLEIGVLGALGLLVIAQRSLTDAERLERGVAAAEGLLDSLALGAAPGGGTRMLGHDTLTWSIDGDGRIRIRLAPGDGSPALELRSVTWAEP